MKSPDILNDISANPELFGLLKILNENKSALSQLAPDFQQFVEALRKPELLTQLQQIASSLTENTAEVIAPVNAKPELSLERFIPENNRTIKSCDGCGAASALKDPRWKVVRFYTDDRSGYRVEPAAIVGSCDHCGRDGEIPVPENDNEYHQLFEKWISLTHAEPVFISEPMVNPIPVSEINQITGRWTLDYYRKNPFGPLLTVNESGEEFVGEGNITDLEIADSLTLNVRSASQILIANTTLISHHFYNSNGQISSGTLITGELVQSPRNSTYGGWSYPDLVVNTLVIGKKVRLPDVNLNVKKLILLPGAVIECKQLTAEDIICGDNISVKSGKYSTINNFRSLGGPAAFKLGERSKKQNSAIISANDFMNQMLRVMSDSRLPDYHKHFSKPGSSNNFPPVIHFDRPRYD
jgi:hypothetical protein